MKVGQIEIGNCVKEPIKVRPDLVRRKLLKHLRDDAFDNEKDAIAQLQILDYAARQELRELDIGFLSMSKPFRGQTFSRLPFFGVYPYHEHKFLPCVAEYQNKEMSWSPHRIFWDKLNNAVLTVDSKPVRTKPLPAAAESSTGLVWEGPAWALATIGGGTQVKSEFMGLIPASTKEKVYGAEDCFEEIDLIAEGFWQEKKILPEPLVVGVWRDKVYLLDQFDTTNMEKYILAEFLA